MVRPRRGRPHLRVGAAQERVPADSQRPHRGAIRARRTGAGHRRGGARVLRAVKRVQRILLALALCAGAARAAPEPEPEPAGMATGDQQAQLDLFVNGDRKDTALVVLRDADILVPVEDLQRAGLTSVTGAHVRVAGREMVSLRSLAPAIEYSFDERALAVQLK